MPKSIAFNQIEITGNGTIFMEWRKLSSDGDPLDYHRTSFAPGSDVDAQIAAVNNHLVSMGFDGVPANHVAQIKLFSSAAWTPENIAPVTAQVVEAIAVQQAAIAESAAKTVEAEAAKAAAEAAETASKAAEASAKQATLRGKLK